MAKQEAKLKVAMVGGGNESFMGHIHRAAIEASGCVELVGGAFGSTRQRSFETGKRLGGDPHRVYGIYRDMFRREAKVEGPERLDFITEVGLNQPHLTARQPAKALDITLKPRANCPNATLSFPVVHLAPSTGCHHTTFPLVAPKLHLCAGSRGGKSAPTRRFARVNIL